MGIELVIPQETIVTHGVDPTKLSQEFQNVYSNLNLQNVNVHPETN